MDNKLKVSIVQLNILWENKQANFAHLKSLMAEKAADTDVFVLPEMFSTGFSMNSQLLAETNEGETIAQVKQWAKEYNTAICGSFIAKGDNLYFNRAFFVTADKEHYYDKRHLFRMGDESLHFAAGDKRLIFEHKGFRICLLVCYDLRFPVWSRNVANEYDLLIYVANWPTTRIKVWNTLLAARAIENMCYVCGVNCVGIDGKGLEYNGNSKMIDARGIEILSIEANKELIETITLSKNELDTFRAKFPVWKDADTFTLE